MPEGLNNSGEPDAPIQRRHAISYWCRRSNRVALVGFLFSGALAFVSPLAGIIVGAAFLILVAVSLCVWFVLCYTCFARFSLRGLLLWLLAVVGLVTGHILLPLGLWSVLCVMLGCVLFMLGIVFVLNADPCLLNGRRKPHGVTE